jgi:DNA-binding MarR family transcriptional regulator
MEMIVRDRSSSVNPPGETTVLFDVWLTSRSVIALLDGALAGTGLDAEDFAIYSVLNKGDGVSPGELATWMSAPATTVSSCVKRLESRGHVRRTPHPDDGRSYRLSLTSTGRRAFITAGRRFLPVLADVERALTVPAAEVQQALRQLRAAVAAVGPA